MSKADEMFEKLGYKKLNKKEIKKCFVEIHDLVECCYEAPMCVWVVFYKNRSFDVVSSKNMQELQAINEKVKELGWYE